MLTEEMAAEKAELVKIKMLNIGTITLMCLGAALTYISLWWLVVVIPLACAIVLGGKRRIKQFRQGLKFSYIREDKIVNILNAIEQLINDASDKEMQSLNMSDMHSIIKRLNELDQTYHNIKNPTEEDIKNFYDAIDVVENRVAENIELANVVKSDKLKVYLNFFKTKYS